MTRLVVKSRCGIQMLLELRSYRPLTRQISDENENAKSLQRQRPSDAFRSHRYDGQGRLISTVEQNAGQERLELHTVHLAKSSQ